MPPRPSEAPRAFMPSAMNERPIPQRREFTRVESIHPRPNEAPVHALLREALGHIDDITNEEQAGVERAETARELARANETNLRAELLAAQNPLERVVAIVGGQNQLDDTEKAALIQQLQDGIRESTPDIDRRVQAAQKRVDAAQAKTIELSDQYVRQRHLVDGEIVRAAEVRREVALVADWLDPRDGNPHFVLRVEAQIRANEARVAQVDHALRGESAAISSAAEEARTQAEHFNNEADHARQEHAKLYSAMVKKYSTIENPNPELAILLAQPHEVVTLRLLEQQAQMYARLADRQKAIADETEIGLSARERAILEAEKTRLQARIEDLQAERPALFKDTLEDKTADLTPVDAAAIELKRELQKLEKLITQGDGVVEGGTNRTAGRVEPEVMQRNVAEALLLNDRGRTELWNRLRQEATDAYAHNDQPRLADIYDLLVGVFGEEGANRVVRRIP